MKKLTYTLMTAACFMITPAMAAPTTPGDAPMVLAQADLDVQVGGERRPEGGTAVRGREEGIRGDHDQVRGGVVVREHDQGIRGRVVIGEGRRSFARERVVVRGGSACRMITVRQRMHNGNMLIRKIRRCG
jgi:hypothetical protein